MKPRIKLKARMQPYDAARHGRRLGTWQPTSAGPNAATLGNLNTLRARSRDAERNNGWIKRGINSQVANEIGTGITPRSQAPDPAFRRAVNLLWEEWIKVADADGVLGLNGMVALAARSRRTAGEVFLRRRMRRLSDDLPVPLQVQILEADMCPAEYDDAARVKAGIAFNDIGRREAYMMYRDHPADLFTMNAGEKVPVPADGIIHHYAPLRPGQLRGIPETVQALIRARDFDEYDDAERTRKKHKSSVMGFIEKPEYTEQDFEFDPMTGKPLDGAGDIPEFALEPGSFPALLPGEKLSFFEGDNTGQGYADYVRQQLLGMAASMDVPYELMTGDMRGINDRVLRAILNEYHRILEQSQWLIVIPQVMDPLWRWFVDAAVLSGAVDAPDYRERRREYLSVEWRPDGWPYLHPVQDIQAKGLKIRYGLSARSLEVAADGEDAERVDRIQQEDKERADGMGLVHDTDPSRTATSGTAQDYLRDREEQEDE